MVKDAAAVDAYGVCIHQPAVCPLSGHATGKMYIQAWVSMLFVLLW